MIVDLFAGPGGWDEGLRLLDRHEDCVGIEWDASACATAEAAGHSRVCADIAALDPLETVNARRRADYQNGLDEGWYTADEHPYSDLTRGELEGLIASPPCQSFSTAGKQLGRADKPYVIQCAHELAAGFDSRHQYGHLLKDERSLLTVEPLRWALALRPRWIAFEQVPAVLELWTLFAGLLTEHGYHATAGVLTAEQYGVPQTRKRAYLVASLDGPVSLPEPTHSKYYGRDPKRLDPDLLPWVSMAQALGWGTTGRPAYTVTGGGAATGGAEPFAKSAREGMDAARERGDWALRMTTMPNSARRPTDRPAPTIAFGHDAASAKWVREDVPASTQELQHPDWPHRRPATTIAGDPRCFQPGGHHTNGSQSHNAIRLSVEEASVLMGFPLGYPWQGTKSNQFQQIGNAVCPPVGARVLAGVMRPPRDVALAA